MTPSVKRLEEAFPGKGKELRALLDGSKDPDDYSDVAEWLAKCHNYPSRVERVMCAVNQVIEGYGTEAIFGDNVCWPDLDYVNMGDPYVTTIYYDRIDGCYGVGNWGSWLEWREGQGRIYA